MPFFIFVYRAWSEAIPLDRMAENRSAWQGWNSALQEDYGIRTASGRVVTAAGVSESEGVVRGASMVDSLEVAIEVAKGALDRSIAIH